MSSRFRGCERGSVTAELAIVLPAVVMLLALVLTTAGAAATQVRCTEAARAGARAAAFGEDASGVRAAVEVVAGAGSGVEVARAGGWVVVRVSKPVASRWGRFAASAEARAWVEPRASGSAP